MMDRTPVLGSGSPASAGSPGTLLHPSSVDPLSPPLDFRELFVRHYPRIKAWYESLSGTGLAVVALSLERFEAARWLVANREDLNTAIIGRHRSCDLCLGADPFVSLRHLVVIVFPRNEEGQARFRLLDLRTPLGFTIENGGRLEALEAQGPVLIGCGKYAVLLLPTGDGAPGWPPDPEAGWEMIPERVYSQARPVPHRRWPGREVSRPGDGDGGPGRTLVHLMPGLRLARRNLLAPGEEARGELVVRSSEGEMTVVVGSRALQQGVVLGRYDRCDSAGLPVLGDPRISRVHLLVVEIAGELHAIDTASKNGLLDGPNTVSRACLSRNRVLQLSGGLATLEWQPIRRPVGDLQARISRSSPGTASPAPQGEPPVDQAGPPPTEQRRILERYDAGQFLQAYELARPHGPVHTWRGTAARILAGRLAANLGGLRLGYALHLHAARADARSPEAQCYAARAILDRQGAAIAWTWIRARGEMKEAPAEARADWLALQAVVAARFRDFEAAQALLGRAESLTVPRPWRCLERAMILEQQDRYADALEAAREALRLQPLYPPGVRDVARLLLILGRGDEARDLLFRATAATESGSVVALLAAVLGEQGRLEEGLEALERFEALSPLLDRAGRGWLAGRRSDFLYELGDLEGARRQAIFAGNPFHAVFAERAARTVSDARRVLLPVPFVRQHHKTCTPATLASLSAFWGRPLDQSAVAQVISYDGTPQHRARAWAAANGWAVREFRVTWQSACALLDRGIPFVLSTSSGMGGHDQAVVGYDARRGTFSVRCPSQPFLVEYLAEPLLDEQKWIGPSGLVFLPPEHAERLEGLDLPDRQAYDDLRAMQVALLAHRRYEAGAIQRRMARTAPEHALTIRARQQLAAYDADAAGLLQCIEALLVRFPDAPSLVLWKLSLLQTLAPAAEFARVLAETCERHGRDGPLLSRLAHHLSLDPQQWPRVRRILRPLLRAGHWPTEALNLLTLANVFEAEGRGDEALAFGRFAACLEDKNEGYARTYFVAARSRGRTDEGLAFLRGRFESYGHGSGDPGQTLFWALEQLGRGTEAMAILDRALSLRPRDAELMLFAAEAYARGGRLDGADKLLAAARGGTRRTTWLRAAAVVAAGRDDRAEALRGWREVLVVEPWAADAHRAVASLLAATEGTAAASAHLRAARERFPHHQLLQQLCAEWENRPGAPPVARARPASRPVPRPAPPDGEQFDALVRLLPILLPVVLNLLSRSCP